MPNPIELAPVIAPDVLMMDDVDPPTEDCFGDATLDRGSEGIVRITSYDDIPEELRSLRNWLVWRIEERANKDGVIRETKVPYNARTGRLAKSNDPATWSSFDKSAGALKGVYNGLGFCLTPPYVGIDLDGCLVNRKLEPWAEEIIRELGSYSELSPSGNGVHVIVKGELPPGPRQKEFKDREHHGVGIYDAVRGRYLTMTGLRVNGHTVVAERTAELRRIYERLFPPVPAKAKQVKAKQAKTKQAAVGTDEELIERARNANDNGKFARLWDGEWDGYYASQSEADLALCAKLAFWTGGDTERIDSLFRQSALMRDKWDRDDYRDRTIAKALEGNESCKANEDHTWPEPSPLGSELPPVEPFDLSLLPEALRGFVGDVAERMQVPPDCPAACLIVTLGGATNRRARIQPKALDSSWTERPNLWGGIIAPPGSLKSPVLQLITAPLQAQEKLARAQYEFELAEYSARKEELDLQLSAWKEWRKGNYKNKKKKDSDEQLARPDTSIKPPVMRRLIIGDATYEKTQELLAENPAGLLMIRDELTGWLEGFEREGRQGEREFFLSAWNGDTSSPVDRIGRGSIFVPSCCMSVIGGITPGRLRSYLVDALADGPSNDGLIQRFQVLVWPDFPKDYRYVDQPPRDYPVIEQMFRKILEWDSGSPKCFRFNAEAQDFFADWLENLECRIRGGDLHPALVSHLGKYRKLMPALALLLCAADQLTTTGELLDPPVVSLAQAEQAAAWCKYLESHAHRIYACVVTAQMQAAADLSAKIKAKAVGGDGTFAVRDVYRHGWSHLDTPERVRAALDVLEDAGWVRKAKNEGSLGRPSNQYIVNPRVHGR